MNFSSTTELAADKKEKGASSDTTGASGKKEGGPLVVTSFELATDDDGRQIAVVSGINFVKNKKTEMKGFGVSIFFPGGQVLQLELLYFEKEAEQLLVDFPVTIEEFPGNFLLSVTVKEKGRSDSFVVTLGSTGPGGAIGPQGPQGEQGPQGLLGHLVGSDVFYTAGGLGVGTSEPSAALEIETEVLGTATANQVQVDYDSASSNASNLNVWQSFKPTTDGILKHISLGVRSPPAYKTVLVTLKIYEGQGTGGTVRRNQSGEFRPAWGEEVELNSGLSVTAGQTYTYEIIVPRVDTVWLRYSGNNPYSRGRAFNGSLRDLVLRSNRLCILVMIRGFVAERQRRRCPFRQGALVA